MKQNAWQDFHSISAHIPVPNSSIVSITEHLTQTLYTRHSKPILSKNISCLNRPVKTAQRLSFPRTLCRVHPSRPSETTTSRLHSSHFPCTPSLAWTSLSLSYAVSLVEPRSCRSNEYIPCSWTDSGSGVCHRSTSLKQAAQSFS